MTAKQVERLLPRVISRVREDGTIGAVERLAGVPQDNASRRALWDPFLSLAPGSTQAYIDAGMAECARRIAEQSAWVAL